ncbi:MAG: hypothetical protein ACXIVG_09410 [Pararhodobacter sp.]
MINWLQDAGGTLTGLFALSLALIPPFPAHPRDGQTSFAANDVAFLNLMGDVEAPRGFDTVSGFAPVPPPLPLTEMTLEEVLRYQERIRAMGTVSSAVGRYQFIYPTLRRLVDELGISGNLRFDAEVQTYLARFLMHDCGFFERQTPLPELGNCLAGVWAALPLVSGPRIGQSVYADDGINRALVAPEVVIEILSRRFEW